DAPGDRGGDRPRARADPLRGRRPHARGDVDRRRPEARLRPRPRAHLAGDRLARLLAAGGAEIAVAHRIYAEALFEAAKDGGRLAQVHEALGDFAAAIEQTPELRNVLRNPQLEPSAKAGILADLAGDDEPIFKNFLLLVAEKGRAGEIEEIAREFERMMARELSDDEAGAIVAQIEQAAGRKVEATRTVDPSILGGIVLQAGSYLAD